MKRIAICLTALILGSTVASADPRWWQDDRVITGGPGNKTNPDVAIIASAPGSISGGAIVVVWQQPGNLAGDTDIYMDASFDGGCSWCGPVAWVTGPSDDRLPRVAGGITARNMLSLQVVFERAGQSILVAGDASISVFDPRVQCRNFGLLGPPVSLTLDGGLGAARPRIAAASAPGRLQFHAVWDLAAGPGTSMHYANDLVGDGSGWGALPVVDLTALVGESGRQPDVGADTLVVDATSTAATVMYVDPVGKVRMTRSLDSGATWDAAVDVSTLGRQAYPAVDSSTGSFGDFSVWNGAVWQETSVSPPVTFDAAFWRDPLSRSPDFDAATDHPASSPPSLPGTAPALSIGATELSTSGGVNSMFAFWQTATTPAEIVSRGGLLNAFDLVKPRNLDRFPFRNERTAPPDPIASEAQPHSNCQWSDGWPGFADGNCLPNPRIGSGAVAVASADGSAPTSLGSDFATVFSDDRSGQSEIYFKITDGTVAAPTIEGVIPECEALQTARVRFYFLLTPECPLAGGASERLNRYLIYYGSEDSEGATPTGPFANRVEVPNVALTNPQLIVIPGLKGGEVYDFALVVEDEARNLNPADFDPRVSGNRLSILQLRDKVSMPACAPRYRLTCAAGADDCGGISDGSYNPGDTVPITLTFTNIGDWVSGDIDGTVTAAGASVASPAFTIPGPLAIAAAAGTTVNIRIDAAPCPPLSGRPAVTAAAVTSDGGAVVHGDLACPVAPVVAVDCASECTIAGCVVGSLAGVRSLHGVKSGGTTATFSWQADLGASEYHLNSVVAKGDITPPTSHRPTVGAAAAECAAVAPAISCVDPDALSVADDRVFYQVYSACGPDGVDEGPF